MKLKEGDLIYVQPTVLNPFGKLILDGFLAIYIYPVLSSGVCIGDLVMIGDNHYKQLTFPWYDFFIIERGAFA